MRVIRIKQIENFNLSEPEKSPAPPQVFNCMPFAATIDNKIFCVHAGLSPELTNLDLINKVLARMQRVRESHQKHHLETDFCFSYLTCLSSPPKIQTLDRKSNACINVLVVSTTTGCFLERREQNVSCCV